MHPILAMCHDLARVLAPLILVGTFDIFIAFYSAFSTNRMATATRRYGATAQSGSGWLSTSFLQSVHHLGVSTLG